jgi:hypothetical protein
VGRFLTILYFFPNYKALGTLIVIPVIGIFFHLQIIDIFRRINLSGLVEEHLKVVAENAAQVVRHKLSILLRPMGVCELKFIGHITKMLLSLLRTSPVYSSE